MLRILRAVVLTSVFCAGHVWGVPVTYDFAGTVNFSPVWLTNPAIQVPGYAGPTFDINPFAGVIAGSSVQGSFTYDTSARIPLSIDGRAVYRSGPEPGVFDPTNIYSMNARFDGGLTYKTTYDEILVDDNFPSDRYVVLGSNRVVGAPTYFTSSMGLDGGSRSLWSGTTLPVSPPSLDTVDLAYFTFNYYIVLNESGLDYEPFTFTARIDSLTLRVERVPEPGTLALVLLGLLGVGQIQRIHRGNLRKKERAGS